MGNMTRSARHRLLTVAYLGSLLWGSSLLIPLFFVPQAAAQSAAQSSWPQRPIRLIVPLTPGGSNDVLGRVVAERLQAAVGQPVLVENRPGAGGNVGTEYVAKQPADGYTLLVSSNTHVVNPSFFARLPYDPIKDFEPVTLAVTVPFMLTVNAATPANSVRDVVQLARSRAKGLTYGTAGPGTPHQLTVELLKTIAGGN
jgi:tripartite-type tricarboxylate transporter receptor subunit TctC